MEFFFGIMIWASLPPTLPLWEESNNPTTMVTLSFPVMGDSFFDYKNTNGVFVWLSQKNSGFFENRNVHFVRREIRTQTKLNYPPFMAPPKGFGIFLYPCDIIVLLHGEKPPPFPRNPPQ